MKHIKTQKEKELEKLSTTDLLSLKVGEEYTMEEIRGEIAMRLHNSEDESELQKLWKVFKELT
jgi:hypothetical protein